MNDNYNDFKFNLKVLPRTDCKHKFEPMRIKQTKTPPQSKGKTSACLRTGITTPTMSPRWRRRNCPVPPKTASRRLRRWRERRRIAKSPESLRISSEASNREGRGKNAGKDCESGSEHYLQSACAPAKPLRSGEHHRRPRTPSILPPPPSPSPLTFSSNGLKCEWVLPVNAVRCE